MKKFQQFVGINSHKDYIALLRKLKVRTKQIEIVLVDEEDTRIADAFEKDILWQKRVNRWWGTTTSGKYSLFRFASSPDFFAFLERFETFFVLKRGDWGDTVEYTDFGINDIAFFDDGAEPLAYTTTHEGFLTLRKDL